MALARSYCNRHHTRKTIRDIFVDALMQTDANVWIARAVRISYHERLKRNGGFVEQSSPVAPIVKGAAADGMLSMLRQQSVRLAVALLSVLVLTRLPSVGFAEEPTSLSAKIQENVVLAADVVSTAVGICVATLDGVVALEAYDDRSDSNPPFIQPSSLRL